MKCLAAFWDGGYGHLSRLSVLLDRLQRDGWNIWVATSARSQAAVRRRLPNVRTVIIECRPPDHRPRKDPPTYSHAFTHAQRHLGLAFDTEFVHDSASRLREVMLEFKPDVIVHDHHDTIAIAASSVGIPVVSVVNSASSMASAGLGAWRSDEAAGRALPSSLMIFNEARRQFGLDALTDERQLFEGDRNLIASAPSLESIRPRPNDHFVGALTDIEPQPLTNSSRRVVCYLGEGNGRPLGDLPDALAQIIRSGNFELDVFASESLKGELVRRGVGGSTRPMMNRRDFVQHIRRSACVLCHGGTTFALAASFGLPTVVLPWTSEAEYVFRAASFGAAQMPPAYSAPLAWRPDPDLGPTIEVAGLWSLSFLAMGLEDRLEDALSGTLDSAAQRLATELFDHNADTNEIILDTAQLAGP